MQNKLGTLNGPAFQVPALHDEKDKKQLEEILKGSQFGGLIANLNILPPSDTTARETIQEEQDKVMGKKRKKSFKDSKLPSTKKSKKSKEKECNDKSLERVAEELALIELESENVHVLEMPSTSGLHLGLDVTTPVHVHVPTEVRDIETHSTDASSVASVLAESFSILDNSELNFSSQSRTEVSRTEERIRNLEHQNYQLSNRVSQLESNFQWLWNSQQQLINRQTPVTASEQPAEVHQQPPGSVQSMSDDSTAQRHELFNEFTKEQLAEKIRTSPTYQKASVRLFRMLYSKEEYQGRSITGQKKCKDAVARPGLEDRSKLEAIYDVVNQKYNHVTSDMVNAVLRDLVKPSRQKTKPNQGCD